MDTRHAKYKAEKNNTEAKEGSHVPSVCIMFVEMFRAITLSKSEFLLETYDTTNTTK